MKEKYVQTAQKIEFTSDFKMQIMINIDEKGGLYEQQYYMY